MPEGFHHASFYHQLANGTIKCELCAHGCEIPDGARGRCDVRENTNGKLHALSYGRLISRALDNIEKKPLYHFLPGTSVYSIASPGCNFRCAFCQNWQISQVGAAALCDISSISPMDVISAAKHVKASGIAYTYTEPSISWEYIDTLSDLAHEAGMANIMVTNGYFSDKLIDAAARKIDAVNIDLKSFSNEFYKEYCGARLAPVLNTIRRMVDLGIHTELTTLLIDGLNDSEDEMKQIAEFISSLGSDVVWHISRSFPSYKMNSITPTKHETIERAIEIARSAGLRYVYAGNIGAEAQNTICPNCKKIVISRRGYSTDISNIKTSDNGFGLCGSCKTQLAIRMKRV